MKRKKILLTIIMTFVLLFSSVLNVYACSIAGAIGDCTTDGRPVLWKNRDSWGTTDCWKTYPYYYEAESPDLIDYIGVTDPDSTFSHFFKGDPDINYEEQQENPVILKSGNGYTVTYVVPWAGANEKGLGLVQAAAHTLKNDFQEEQGYTADQDINDITNGMLNHLILSRCETVDDVEQLLRDSNDGWYAENSARNTSSIVMVFDKYGAMATFEICGSDFTRSNTTTTDYGTEYDDKKRYNLLKADEKDLPNPDVYNGFDWRTNFCRVSYERSDGFDFFVDDYITTVEDNEVINTDNYPDGIDDREYSPSAVKRYGRVGSRLDDNYYYMNGENNNLSIDYKYFIQKNVGSHAIPNDNGQADYMETLSRFIGPMPDGDGERSTGYYLNRFCTTFSVVITGSKPGDPDEGAFTTIWLAQGEPGNTLFFPLMPVLDNTPEYLNNMYETSNDARHFFYDYTDNDSTGYSSGRNIDRAIDVAGLMGDYYGESSFQNVLFDIQSRIFNTYEWTIDECMDIFNAGYDEETTWLGVMGYIETVHSGPGKFAFEYEDFVEAWPDPY